MIALAAMVIWIYFTGVGRGMFSQDAGFSLGSAVGALALPLLIALPLILAGIVLMIIVDQLVVPIMAMERCGFKEAWGKSSAVLRANSKDCWLYLCLYFALSIICGIILIFAVFLAVFALLLVAGIIAGLLYALVVGLFKFSALFYFLAVIIGVPFILIVFLILFALNLPFALFLKSFSLYFLSSLDCRYEPLPLEGPSQDEA